MQPLIAAKLEEAGLVGIGDGLSLVLHDELVEDVLHVVARGRRADACRPDSL